MTEWLRKLRTKEGVLIFIAAALLLGFVILGMMDFMWSGGDVYDTPIEFDQK